MSTRPIDSVFGVPERPRHAQLGAPISDIADHGNGDVPTLRYARGAGKVGSIEHRDVHHRSGANRLLGQFADARGRIGRSSGPAPR